MKALTELQKLKLRYGLVFMIFIAEAILPASGSQHFVQETVKSLGMGGTSVAIANDYQALYTNPAGLALQKENVYSPISFIGQQNDDYDGIIDRIDALDGSDTPFSRESNYRNLIEIMGETGWQSWTAQAYYLGSTGFGVSAYHRDIEQYSVENPANPIVRSEVYQDTVLSGSIARSFSENQVIFNDRATGWWGASVKVASRKKTEVFYSAKDFAALNPEALKDTDKSGVALDFDIGMLWQLNSPWKPSIGLFFGNVLGSEFSDEAGNMNRQFAAGISIKPLSGTTERSEKLVLAADYWDTNNGNSSLSNLRLGAQIQISNGLHLLCGLRGGYPTAGINLKWYDFQLQAATYAEELGKRPGNKEDRRTAISATMEF